MFGSILLAGSKIGRVRNALRENQTAAACMGATSNATGYRLCGRCRHCRTGGALFALAGSSFSPEFYYERDYRAYRTIVPGGTEVSQIMLGVRYLQVLPEVSGPIVSTGCRSGFCLVCWPSFVLFDWYRERLIGIDPAKSYHQP